MKARKKMKTHKAHKKNEKGKHVRHVKKNADAEDTDYECFSRSGTYWLSISSLSSLTKNNNKKLTFDLKIKNRNLLIKRKLTIQY